MKPDSFTTNYSLKPRERNGRERESERERAEKDITSHRPVHQVVTCRYVYAHTHTCTHKMNNNKVYICPAATTNDKPDEISEQNDRSQRSTTIFSGTLSWNDLHFICGSRFSHCYYLSCHPPPPFLPSPQSLCPPFPSFLSSPPLISTASQEYQVNKEPFTNKGLLQQLLLHTALLRET